MNSAFDAAFKSCDEGLRSAFGELVSVQLPGQVVELSVEFERTGSLQRMSRGSAVERGVGQWLAVFSQADIPEDYSGVRVMFKGNWWAIVEPDYFDDDVEFLLVSVGQAGSVDTNFISFSGE